MYKIITLIISLFISFTIEGQTTIKKKKDPQVIQFVSLNSSVFASHLNAGKYAFRVNDALWDNAWGSSINIGFGQRVSKKLDLLIGIGFQTFHVAQVKDYGYWVCDTTQFRGSTIDQTQRIIRLRQIELPIEMRYKFQMKKFVLYPAIGFTLAYYIDKSQKIDFLLSNGTIYNEPHNNFELDHNRTINFAPSVKLGASYKLERHLSITSEVYYAYNLGKDDIFNYLLDEFEDVRITSLGIQLGIEYAIRMKR